MMSDQSPVWFEIEKSVKGISLHRRIVSLSNEFDPTSIEQLNKGICTYLAGNLKNDK